MPPKRKSPPPKWTPQLFSCLKDTRLCCPVSWCQCIAAGQLYQRIFGFGCLSISVIFWGFVVSTVLFVTTSTISLDAYFNLDALTIDNPFTTDEYLFMGILFGVLAPICAIGSIVSGTVILCQVRRHIRTRDKIQVNLGVADDCCIPFWCGPCAMVQMLRHEGVTGSSYSLCSPTAGSAPSTTSSKSKKIIVQKVDTPKCSRKTLCVSAVGMVMLVLLAWSAFTVLVVTSVAIDLSKIQNTTNARIRPLGTEEALKRRRMYDGESVYRNVAESLVDDELSRNVATVLCPERDEILDTFKIKQVFARGYPDVHGDNVYSQLFGTELSNPYGIDIISATHSKTMNVRNTLGCRVMVNASNDDLASTILNITNVEEYNFNCTTPTICYAMFGSEEDADSAITTLSDGVLQNATFTKKLEKVQRYKSRGNILMGCKNAADYVRHGKYSCGIAALYTSYDFGVGSGNYEDIDENFHIFWLYPEIARFLQTGLPYGHIIGTYRDAVKNKKSGKTCDVQIDWLIDFNDTLPQNTSNTWMRKLVIEQEPRKNAPIDVSNYVLNFPGWKWSTIFNGWFGPFWKDTCDSFGIKDDFADINDYGYKCAGRCLHECESVQPYMNASTCPTCNLKTSDLFSDGKDGLDNVKMVDPCWGKDWSCSLK